MLMLLSVHVTSVLFLVQFNNFALTMGFYWSYILLCALAEEDHSYQLQVKTKPCPNFAFDGESCTALALPSRAPLSFLQSSPAFLDLSPFETARLQSKCKYNLKRQERSIWLQSTISISRSSSDIRYI